VLPPQPTSTPATFVAGVRFRAWQPPSALHPNEAEARRGSRFRTTGHTPGPIELVELRQDGEFPRTLDLRTVPPAAARQRIPST